MLESMQDNSKLHDSRSEKQDNAAVLLQHCALDAFVEPSLQKQEGADQNPNGIAEAAFSLSGNAISGFKKIESAPAVDIYQSGDDYVVSADLSAGAELDLLTGDLVNTGRKSVYGGPDPDFKRMSVTQALNKERVAHPDVVCVANAEFFSNLRSSSAALAFPIKLDGNVLSEGFAAIKKHQGKRLTVEINKDSADIVPFNNKGLRGIVWVNLPDLPSRLVA